MDKLIFPTDFVILDFEEDKKIPIILGRPFLATGRTLIDVQKGELTMRVHDQKVTFNVFKAMKFPADEEECFKVDMVDAVVNTEIEQLLNSGSLDKALQGESDIEDDERAEHVQLLKAPPWTRRFVIPLESLELADFRDAQVHYKPSSEEALPFELKPLPPEEPPPGAPP